jgi:hypothetical protein
MKPITDVIIKTVQTIGNILSNPNLVPDNKFLILTINQADPSGSVTDGCCPQPGTAGFYPDFNVLIYNNIVTNIMASINLLLFIIDQNKSNLAYLKAVDPVEITLAINDALQKILSAGNIADFQMPSEITIGFQPSITLPPKDIEEMRRKLSATQLEIAYKMFIVFSTVLINIAFSLQALVLPVVKPIHKPNNCGCSHKKPKVIIDNQSQSSQSSDPFESIEAIIGLFALVINGVTGPAPDPIFPSLASANTLCLFRGWFNSIIQSFQQANLPTNINGLINAFGLMASVPSSSIPALDLTQSEVCPTGSELIGVSRPSALKEELILVVGLDF